MNKFLPMLAGALALSWALGVAAQSKPPKPSKPTPSAAAAKKLYCWNENGRKVCGDALPASAVDSERTELSGRSGLRIGGVDRALNDAERAQHETEQKRLAAEAEAAEAAKRRDLALVASYTSEEELRRAYRIRYELIDEAIKSSRLALDNLHQSLLRMLEQAGENELSGKPVSKPLADNIRARRTSYLDLQAGHQKQQRERAAIDAQLQQAVARYREMKATEPGAAPAETNTPG
ncbi:hypothetical protein M2650_14890 [Luteimonas sp. SX5]|uniref:DUF4124 domain-containing protein n=1 Tax=Luteimonas galliterrae TaxID=2940486 RepID=A0ABT0MNR2_9GAMM|nr:hypothetical protein [Luteimonas galliterrae]MCL1635914.1 hypothetical protein [Luteimonas galliterrae]